MLYAMMDVRKFLACIALLHRAHSAPWTYAGPTGTANWPTEFPVCGKTSQSPINIVESDVIFDTSIGPFEYTNYDTPLTNLILTNNGHTVVIALGETPDVTIQGGDLPFNSYKAFQLHFHWGMNVDSGSEHLLNQEAFPMELHIVHYNTKYSNPGAATTKAEGLAVLGFMYEVNKEDNIHYSEIVTHLSQVPYPDNETVIQSASINSLLPKEFSEFYRYSGSLTTPPCSESVTWTIFKQPITISELQLNEFRRLLDSHNDQLVNNYRPVQPLNGRKVTANFNPVDSRRDAFLELDELPTDSIEDNGVTRRASFYGLNELPKDTREQNDSPSGRQSAAKRVAKKHNSDETELNEKDSEEDDDEDD